MPGEQGVPIAEAARILGLSTEAVRKRIARQSLRGYKHGRQWYVLIEHKVSGHEPSASGQAAFGSRQPDHNGQLPGHSDLSENNLYQVLVDTLRDEIAFLRQQLQERDEELRRKDALMASLTQRIPALPDHGGNRDQTAGPVRRRLWSWLPW